jgi:O-antigen ligase
MPSIAQHSFLTPPALYRLAGSLALLLLAAAIAYAPLLWVAGGLAAAAASVLALRWPWLIWLPLALWVPLTSTLRLGPASATDLLLATGVALWFLAGARRHMLSLTGSPVISLAILITAVLTLSLFFAVDLDEAIAEIIKWLQLPVLLLVVPAMLTARQARWLAAALTGGAVLQAGIGLYQFVYSVGPDHFVILGRFMRASGVFDQPNPYGGFLGIALAASLSLTLWAWGEVIRGGGQHRSSAGWAIFYTGSTALIAGGLLASWSRGAWFGAAAGVTAVLMLRSRFAAVAATFTLLALLLLGTVAPTSLPQPLLQRLADLPAYWGLTDVLAQPVTDENFSVVERIAHWTAAQRMWERSPWLGIGAGNYAALYPTVRLPRWEEALGHAHNFYLNLLGETGLLGLSTWLALWAGIAVYGWRNARSQGTATPASRWRAAVAVALLGIVVHLSVHNLVDNLFVRGNLVYTVLWLAVLAAQSDRLPDTPPNEVSA